MIAKKMKKDGVGIYYKNFLANCPAEVKNLNECVIFEVSTKNKRGHVVPLCRSPSHKTSLTLF